MTGCSQSPARSSTHRTRKPIESFTLVSGRDRQDGGFTYWDRRSGSKQRHGGRYEIRFTEPSAHGHRLRIEAEGYAPGISRSIADDEGDARVDFELLAAESITGLVRLAGGGPVAGADVVLVIPSEPAFINNGRPPTGRDASRGENRTGRALCVSTRGAAVHSRSPCTTAGSPRLRRATAPRRRTGHPALGPDRGDSCGWATGRGLACRWSSMAGRAVIPNTPFPGSNTLRRPIARASSSLTAWSLARSPWREKSSSAIILTARPTRPRSP